MKRPVIVINNKEIDSKDVIIPLALLSGALITVIVLIFTVGQASGSSATNSAAADSASTSASVAAGPDNVTEGVIIDWNLSNGASALAQLANPTYPGYPQYVRAYEDGGVPSVAVEWQTSGMILVFTRGTSGFWAVTTQTNETYRPDLVSASNYNANVVPAGYYLDIGYVAR